MIGLYILGFYFLLASIFGPDFAKLHISPPFLNFPIFVGEIVLFLCLMISGWLILKKKIQLTNLQYLFFGYLGFIILWAVYDCWRVPGPPLALRNAVLFFYPIFAFFWFHFLSTCYFFSKAYSSAPSRAFIIVVYYQ